MKPLIHPSIDDVTVEGILHALSDPVRVAIYADMAGASCAKTCSTFLQMVDRSIPKSTLSQHFRTLREAGLVRSERQGVEMLNTTRCREVEQRFPGLLAAIINAHRIQLAEKNLPARRRSRSKIQAS
ncbi:MAG: helix-turn-helix domain-containing protein [Pseudomonadota bacterium]|nr:helix-turn-helix domain-containing protein [Pseudomonadota bacterium]